MKNDFWDILEEKMCTQQTKFVLTEKKLIDICSRIYPLADFSCYAPTILLDLLNTNSMLMFGFIKKDDIDNNYNYKNDELCIYKITRETNNGYLCVCLAVNNMTKKGYRIAKICYVS